MKGASQDQSETESELEATLSEATSAIKLSIAQNTQLGELLKEAKDTIKSYKNCSLQSASKASQIYEQTLQMKKELETLKEEIHQKVHPPSQV